ncbi:JmjC domain-containing protein [Colletotrichum orchidophilum]|uniref:JmjC domain-containing protein n=1 Tax=Colletotrichum orchidophilum TaxID=1209926 RepID=A0A1G4AWB6_9PEZI|nr:JmjC domain-containing protein [Colletotrichum orchidophilum]OHE93459.1 JmjC domain-containing protein [Colletotrichum orchidophilum]
MRQLVRGCCRTFRSPPKASQNQLGFSTVSSVEATDSPFDAVDIDEFRRLAFTPGQPLFFEQPSNLSRQSSFPASSKWFAQDGDIQPQVPSQGPITKFTPHVDRFAHHMFPYELMSPQITDNSGVSVNTTTQFHTWLASGPDPMGAILAGIVHAASHPDASEPRFSSFMAPLLLLLKAAEFNSLHEKKIRQLYIAQAQLPDLPPELQEDLPVPRIVLEAGKGDVYNSSVWLGLEPTYTPLHRDPNPNLFCQLVGNKTIRLLPPFCGDQLYRRVQIQVHQSGNSRIRSTEMMEGRERVAMNTAIWGLEDHKDITEAKLSPGNALFIPKGWWHSVKSGHRDGRLNASVNWWFR